jgi:hypothetical protein
VQKLEKLAPRSASTVQEHRLTFKDGNCFLATPVEKNPI